MSKEKKDYEEESISVDVNPEDVDKLTQMASNLAMWRERNTLNAIITGLEEMQKQISLTNNKKNDKFNSGYLKATSDIIYSIKVLLELQEEDLPPTIIEEN